MRYGQHGKLELFIFKRLEKMTSFQTLDCLCREAALGKRDDFQKFLKLAPDVPAQAGDDIAFGASD